MSSTEANQIDGGEVIGDGDDEEGCRSGARAWERAMRCAPVKIDGTSSLVKPRARVRRRGGIGKELGVFNGDRVICVD